MYNVGQALERRHCRAEHDTGAGKTEAKTRQTRASARPRRNKQSSRPLEAEQKRQRTRRLWHTAARARARVLIHSGAESRSGGPRHAAEAVRAFSLSPSIHVDDPVKAFYISPPHACLPDPLAHSPRPRRDHPRPLFIISSITHHLPDSSPSPPFPIPPPIPRRL
jgi:hypothetical protein